MNRTVKTQSWVNKRNWVFLQLIVLTVSMSVPLLSIAADPSEPLRFEDSRIPNSLFSDIGKPWKESERRLVLDAFAIATNKAPGLMKRATAFRPIRLYRPKGVTFTDALAVYDAYDNAILFSDGFFRVGTDRNKAHGGFIHELSHLADIGQKVAFSREWTGLIEDRIRRVEEGMRQRQGSGNGGTGCQFREELALKEGFPSAWASASLVEALAEFVRYTVIPGQQSVPEEIRRFVRQHMLSTDFTPDQSMQELDTAHQNLQTGRLPEAIRALDRAIALDKGFLLAYGQRAKINAAKKNIRAQIEDLTQAIKVYPAASLVYSNYMERGRAWATAGLTPAALQDFTKAVNSASVCDPYPYFWRGKLYLGVKNWEKANADFTEAISRAPQTFPTAYLERGKVWNGKHMSKEAIADYTKAIELYPTYAEAYYRRGLTFVVSGEREKALADLEKTRQLKPSWIKEVEEMIKQIKSDAHGKK